MITLSNSQLWVRDQDEALAFYTEKLGWEVRSDYSLPELGDFRWLTVGPPRQSDVGGVRKAKPGAPGITPQDTPDDADRLRDLMAKGLTGTLFLTTDDCQAAYEELRARGVEFTEEPQERPYGVDSALRDPSGNSIRITQVREPATA